MVSNDSIDWQKFVGLCSNHLVIPSIYLKFKSQDILKYLPEVVADYLKEIYELNLERNTQIQRQIKEVTEILNKNSIYPVYLKGTGNLISGLYSDTGERMIGDIDFLVHEIDYLKAANLIKSLGYTADIPDYFDVNVLKHYPRLFKANEPADIEIHRLPVSEQYISVLNPELIEKEKKSASALNGCFVLSNKHSILLNFIHGQLAHLGQLYGIIAFRDLYDLYLVSKKYEVSQTLPEIKTKQKAIAYFVFAGHAFGLPGKFYPEENLQSRILKRKHHLNLNSRIFYHTFRTVAYFSHRIFSGYIRLLFQSFYSGKSRQSVYRRLSNRKWYAGHIGSYYNYFKGK